MDICDCHCDDKVVTGKWCDKNESQQDIKLAGDIIKESEQCEVVPNIQKGIFRLWCRLRKIIITICDILQRMVCLQKKIKSLCKTLHCMKTNIIEANSITVGRNKDMIKRYGRKAPNTPNDNKGIYEEAKVIYEQQLKRLEKSKARLEEMKKDPSVEEIDGVFLSGNYNTSATGSFNYYSNFSLATSKTSVEYVDGGIQGNGSVMTLHHADLQDGKVIKLPNVGVTSSGKQIDIKLTLKKIYTRSNANSFYVTGIADRYLIIDGNNGISFNLYKIYRLDGKFEFVDTSGNPISLMTVGVVTDIDYHQGFNVSFNETSKLITKIPSNSNVKKQGNYYHDTTGVAVQDESSIPKGSMMMAGVGSSMDFSIILNYESQAQNGDTSDPSDWLMTFFGNTFKGEVVDLHKPSKPIPPIKECNLMSCDFDCLGDN